MNKSAIILFVFCAIFTSFTWSQGSQRLKDEQQKLEKKISDTKVLLEKSKKETKLSLDEVNLIEKQLTYREQLLRNIDNQIRSSELKMEQKNTRIQELNAEIELLKKQYAGLLLLAYKKRSRYGNLMYIFNAHTIEEAVKRKLYLDKLAEIQKKQMRLIQQNQVLLSEEIEQLNEEKKEHVALSEQKKIERLEILKTKSEKEQIYIKFKKQEDELLKELQKQEKDRERLKQEIAKAIQKEIAEEQARLEKIRAAEEAKRREEEAKKGKTTVPTKEESKKTIDFSLTAEAKLVGEDFSTNKGRLPWPVEKGTITSDYGKHKHPVLDIYTQNNGIDISTVLNANVHAVFKGEVTTVINIPGAGKVVIIKHGEYRTVYSNLRDVYVTKGSIVDAKTPIGSLLPNLTGEISVAHFEIHKASGNNVTQLTPNLWIAK